MVDRATALIDALDRYRHLPLSGFRLVLGRAWDMHERVDLIPGPAFDLVSAYNVAVWAADLQHAVTVRRTAPCEVYFSWTLAGFAARVAADLNPWRVVELLDRITLRHPGKVSEGRWTSWEFDPAVVLDALADHPAITTGGATTATTAAAGAATGATTRTCTGTPPAP